MRLLLTAALSLSLLFTSCQKETPTSVFIDPALLILAPPDTEMIVGVRADKLRSTEAFKKFVEPRLPDFYRQFMEETGVDPKKIQELMLVMNSKSDQVPILLVRGKLSQAPLAAIGGDRPELRLVQKGWKEETMNGMQVASRDGITMAFINGGVAVVGKSDRVKNLLEQRAKGGPSRALQGEIQKVDYRHQVWMAAGPGTLSKLQIPSGEGGMLRLEGVSQSLQRLQGGHLGFDFSNGAFLQIALHAANVEDAKQLHDTVRGLIGLGRISTPKEDTQRLSLIDAVKVEQSNKDLNVKADWSAQQLEKVWQLTQ
jgi:hypothetical protein